jgi:hypothetical protein
VVATNEGLDAKSSDGERTHAYSREDSSLFGAFNRCITLGVVAGDIVQDVSMFLSY